MCQSTTRLAVDDAFISSAHSQSNYGTKTVLSVGTDGTLSTLIKPHDLAGIPAGAKVIAASLVVYIFDGGDASSVRSLSSTWNPSTVTYATAPGLGTVLATLPAGRSGMTSVSLPSSAVQAWLDGAPVYGFTLDPTGADRVDMRSSEYALPSERPYLEVRWKPAGGP